MNQPTMRDLYRDLKVRKETRTCGDCGRPFRRPRFPRLAGIRYNVLDGTRTHLCPTCYGQASDRIERLMGGLR